MLAVVIAEGVAIALLAVLVLGLLRSHALILRALHELGAGLELEKEAAARRTRARAGRRPGPGQIEPGSWRRTRDRTSSAAHDVVGVDLRAAHGVVEVAGAARRRPCSRSSPPAAASASTYWEEFGPDTENPGDAPARGRRQGRPDESPSALTQAGPAGGCGSSPRAPPGPTTTSPGPRTSSSSRTASSRGRARPPRGRRAQPAPAGRRRERPRPSGAGRTGPGATRRRRPRPGGRDDLSRIDAELFAAGMHPGPPEPARARPTPDDQPGTRRA